MESESTKIPLQNGSFMLYSTRLNLSSAANPELDDKKNKDKESVLSFEKLKNKLQKTHGNQNSKSVYVISCFYSIKTIQLLFDSLPGRNVFLVVSALGHASEKINEIVDDLKKVKRNRNKKIYVCTKFPLMHSKIYYSEKKRIDGANCLVGSANLSENGFSNNEEILVDVENVDTKKQIRSYIKKIIEESIDIDKYNGLVDRNFGKTDFASFVSSGYIVFKPNNQIQLNYSGEPLRKIAKNLKNDVENGTQNSELSIDLEKYITSEEYLCFPIDTNIKSGARIKNHCIESCFGFWLPRGKHHDSLSKRDEKEVEKVEKQINKIIEGLNRIDVSSDKFKSYLQKFYSSIKNGNQKVTVSEEQKLAVLEDVGKFVARQVRYLEKRKRSLANGFLITPMPYFWDDSCAAREFYDSFWENVESRKQRGVARELFSYFEKGYQDKNWMTLMSKDGQEWK